MNFPCAQHDSDNKAAPEREKPRAVARTISIREALPKLDATLPSAIPDLLEPQLLTVNSERGMMVVGFEEIAGVRYYQGWWMQWVNE
jgi:hypothetical protein